MLRRVCGLEKAFIDMSCNIVLGFKFANRDDLSIIKKKIIERTIGLRLKVENDIIYKVNDDIVEYNLPNHLNNFHDSFNYINKYYPLNTKNRLANIINNDEYLMLNISHSVCDGLFASRLVHSVSKDDDNEDFSNVDLNPVTVENFFKKDIKRYNKNYELPLTDKNLVRFFSREKSDDSRFKVAEITIPLNTMFNYNKSNQRLSKNTESLYSAIGVTASAMTGCMDRVGIATAYDMRRLLKPSDNTFSVCNFASSITVHTDVSPNDTVYDVARKMRASLNDLKEKNEHFDFMNSFNEATDSDFKFAPGSFFELSSMGQFDLGHRIKDFSFLLGNDGGAASNDITFLCYSVKSAMRNDFVGFLSYSNMQMSDSEAHTFNKGITYCLKNLNPNMKYRDAVQLVKNIL